jgi:plasmid stabilization system protein ParE
LQEIFEYIEQHSPQNAAEMIERLLDAIDSLEMFPHRFKVVQNTDEAEAEVRSMPVKPFLVRYHVDDADHVVTILSVRHGARRPE